MQILEQLVQSMWKEASEQTDALSTLDVSIDVPRLPFPRVKYDDVLTLLDQRDLHIEWGEDLSTEAEKLLGSIMKEKKNDFYFITRYPLQAKPFYTMPEAETYSRGFDLECKGVELASGSQRIHDIALLEERMKVCGLNPDDFSAYLDAFRYGIPPHGGFGFGIERFMMELLDIKNIRECILFPRDRTRLNP